jgi:AraC-like DNA-binding protein
MTLERYDVAPFLPCSSTRRMKPNDTQSAISLVRVGLLLRYIGQLENAGAPVGRFLTQTKIPANLLQHPGAVIPLEHGFRFVELACRKLGTEHLGFYVGQANLLEGLGPFGDILRRALTLHEYFDKATRLYNMLMTNQRIWLSQGADEVRFNVTTMGDVGVAAYQSHLENFVVTIDTIRNVAGPDWSPREVSIAYRPRETLPDTDLFAGSRVTTGTGESWLTIPRALLQKPLWMPHGANSPSHTSAGVARPLPEDLYGLVQLQVGALLTNRAVGIDVVAESLIMSRRSLQRRLADQGLTFSEILAETRLARAADWLQNTDKPVGEIAFDLGYRDASNFTRAFRKQTGVSPQRFRNDAGQH